MAVIEFTKMQGLGNDFVVINGLCQSIKLTPVQIQQMADRHYGIGFDQLLLLEQDYDSDADFIYRIFNADGTEVSQCGNGARCIAKFALAQGIVRSSTMKAKTKKGILSLIVEDNDLVTVNMGVPTFEPESIPLIAVFNTNYWVESVPVEMASQGKVSFQAVSVGNPHAIIWQENEYDYNMDALGKYLNSHSIFPEGVNVSFVQLINNQHVRISVYERGTGLTLACGSAACAVAVAGIHTGVLQEKVTVSQKGGDLVIHWAGQAQPVYMSGKATFVFTGKIQI